MTPLRMESVIVQVDSREQEPFNLSPLKTETATLQTGDYRLLAAPDAVVVERKTISDLLGCIGHGRERFEKELGRLRAYPARVVVVEGSWHELISNERSKLTPESITGTIAAWTARYCPFHFAGSRELAQNFAKRFLFSEARRLWVMSEAFRQGDAA